jgi:4-hydroxybenzoate polyprenyltransferase
MNLLKIPVLAFLKLMRIENLLIIALTMFLIRYALLKSLLVYDGWPINFRFSDLDFVLVVLATVFIAGAGNIINDYFDVKTDRINHPESVVIDRTIKRRTAMAAHLVLNVLGIMLGIYTAYKAGNIKIATIYLIAAGTLWYYSTTFKKQLIIGNIIVSILTAMIPMLVMIYDMPPIVSKMEEVYREQIEFNGIYKYIFVYSGFAFLTSLIREIIKDAEDMEGDLQTGCQTIPIVWGIRTTKVIVISLISNMILILSFILYKMYGPAEKLPTLYILIMVLLPLIFLMFKVFISKTSNDFRKASLWVKLIMLSGIGFTLVIFYISKG